MDTGFLEGLGLTRNEAKLYLALLQLGLSSPAELMRASGLHRSRVYDGVNRLMDKGLAGSVKVGNKSKFEAMDADKLLDFVGEQRKGLDKLENELEAMLPKLRSISKGQPIAEAHVLVGVEGFKAMRRDVLKHARGEHLLIGAIGRENEVMPDFFTWWNKQRKAQGIAMRILHKESAKGKMMTKLEMSTSRFLPPEIDNPAVINVYGDRVVNVIWKDDYPIVFQMINQEIADAYRHYFELLWKMGEKKRK